MPGQLHLDKDFTAKENVHADIPKKPITDSEGATSNDLTVQANNLLSGKGDKEEKETTRMGTLTKKHYTAATVFMDHYSWLKYVHLMTKLTFEETMDAKQAFKHFAKQHGVRILHYHCDYGRFADNAFKNSCSTKGQRLTFCGVNAHF